MYCLYDNEDKFNFQKVVSIIKKEYIKQPDKKLKARGLTVYISDIRNCTSREQEEERVFQELANIRAKFSQKTGKPLSSYDKRKYVWKLVYTYLLGYDIDFGHMQAIELLAGATFSEKLCGYLAVSILLKGKDELMTLVVNTIKRDLTLVNQDPIQCLALCAIANIGGRDMAHALGDDVRRIALSPRATIMARKKAILAMLRIHRETPEVVRLPTELEVAQLADPMSGAYGGIGLSLCACALLRHMIQFANESDLAKLAEGAARSKDVEEQEEEEDDDPEEKKARTLRLRQRPQVQAIMVRAFHLLSVHRSCASDYFYHGTAAPFLQVALLQVLRAMGDPPTANEIREPLFEGLRCALTNVKWTKSSTMNNSSRCVAFEAIALVVQYGKDSKIDLVDACIELLGRFAASKNLNTRYLALASMSNIARTVAERNGSLKEVSTDRWQHALAQQKNSILASLKDVDISVKKRALDLLFHVCDETNAGIVVDELLNNLQTSVDLQPEFKEEMVLRIAILAERFAKTSKWYLDTAIRLLDAGDEHVGDDIWHRVAQIIANQEELQSHAALRMYKTLLQPGHVPVALIKVAAYVIGEFGYMLTEYSTEESGELDHDVLPIDLFGACHRHFAMADSSTKIVLLSTYSKLLNLYEDLQEPVEEVFESQKRATDCEVQQRACEYAYLATRVNVETMNHILEPMPPWPESTRNKLEQQLEKLSKSGSVSTPEPSTTHKKVVHVQHMQKCSPSSSSSKSSVKRKAPESFIDVEDEFSLPNEPPPPRPQPNSPSSIQHAANRKLYMNALLTSKSLLYDDGRCQLGSHQMFSKGHGTIELFVGNLSSVDSLLNVHFEISNPEMDALSMVTPPGANRHEEFSVAPGAQIKFPFQFVCNGAFMTSPEVLVIHSASGHHLARAKFPISLASFLEPFPMGGIMFDEKWRQLGLNESFCQSKSLRGDKCKDWDSSVSKCFRLFDLMKLAKVPDWPPLAVDDDDQQNTKIDLAGAGVLNLSSSSSSSGGPPVGVMARIEIMDDSKSIRVSVRATMGDVAECLLFNIHGQVARLFGEES